jgi:hypothetical protein
VSERTRGLHDTLVELHEQLGRADALDPALRDELRAAMDEIRGRVEAGAEAEQPLAERVSDLMLRFEAAHPALADAVGGVVRALARLGI